jgi:lipid-A-disaccharide synthase
MISAGETSGELYGALLSRALLRKWPDTEITGIGGHHMKNEGVRLIAETSGSLGLVETVRHWGQLFSTFRKAREFILKNRPDILVLIDFPDFNLVLAKKARSAGIPILYYVSPQVWAWRSGRIKKIASLVNKMAVLFPFEADIYKGSGLDCEFVGHPLAETIHVNKSKEELKEELGLKRDGEVIALLPGSRDSEVKRHLPIIRKAAELINRELPGMQIVVPLTASTTLDEDLPDYVSVVHDRTSEAVACSEAAAVASGTATLEASLLGTPMVVFYRISSLTYFIGKLLIKVKNISLVNLISGKEVVKELIQKDATAENIFDELRRIVQDRNYRNTMIGHLKKIKEIMGDRAASQRVASLVGQLAGWNNTNG